MVGDPTIKVILWENQTEKPNILNEIRNYTFTNILTFMKFKNLT